MPPEVDNHVAPTGKQPTAPPAPIAPPAGAVPAPVADAEPEIMMAPLDWQRERKTAWPLACLAAALAKWDARGEDELVIDRATYDRAVGLATDKLTECRALAGTLPDSSAARRVFIMAHPSHFTAVVAHRPNVKETMVMMENLQGQGASEDPVTRRDLLLNECWSRVLWPASGSVERQALMDEMPGAFAVAYPNAYSYQLGLAGPEVRKKP